jgi:hypothetical protein
MTINIDLGPDEERALLDRARLSGSDLAGYIQTLLKRHLEGADRDHGQRAAAEGPTLTFQDLVDSEAIASCANEADASVTLDEIRAATSKIKGSMARVVIEEVRAERF